MPVDLKAIIKIIKKSLDQGHMKLSYTHEHIVTNTIYNKAIFDVISLLEGIDNGSIDSKSLKQMVEE